jgi:hypothetical protein
MQVELVRGWTSQEALYIGIRYLCNVNPGGMIADKLGRKISFIRSRYPCLANEY